MEYRELGRTGLKASVIGFGAEWIGKMEQAEVNAMAARGAAAGVNIVDCWMSDPAVRSALGEALEPTRAQWIIQGHVGSTWQDGQYVRTRDLSQARPAFEDLLARLRTDHVEIGMIHYVDSCDEFRSIMAGDFIGYMRELVQAGKVGHIGLSTHNPEVALLAVDEPEIEVIMFSLNPAFDMMPASENLDDLFGDYENVSGDGIEPARARLYARAEAASTAITVMKGYAGGRLLSAEASPFGVALTPVQCIHYALTRPAVASIMVGVETVEQLDEALGYESATAIERDYASVLAGAPKHAYMGQCTYCGHCAPCTVGINIALANKFADLAAMADEVPVSVAAHYEAMPVTAGACIACGDCEPRCPFGVPIIERMEAAEQLFGC
ncbi:aldo/keto reductase [Adlercreutzia sp. R21]|uniref:aldo/keto reductase n=1 Tax=Adlercreutzia wanghongyangiae TaxID=3111451 RepID=UPI002DBB3C2B|nr:aldo/keto reductase [Adlercreutzia sp. R21]MEC4185275.1 aldo/keto reductase [Adlercreutzia sp. R21]